MKSWATCWGCDLGPLSGSRQFRPGIVFLEFLAAENLINTIPAPLFRGMNGMGHRVTEHRVPYQAAAENLKNTIPAPSAVAEE